jgi:hypothetical protein
LPDDYKYVYAIQVLTHVDIGFRLTILSSLLLLLLLFFFFFFNIFMILFDLFYILLILLLLNIVMVIQEKLDSENFVMIVFLILLFGFDCDDL